MSTRPTTATPTAGQLFDQPASGAQPVAVVAPPEVAGRQSTQERIARGLALIEAAKSVTVTNPAEYVAAGEQLQQLRGAFKDHETDRREITDPLRLSIERTNAFFKPHGEGLQGAGEIIKGKLNAYDAEQARIAEQKQREAEAEAKRVRDAAEAKAKAERDAAEAKAKAEREEADRQRRAQEDAERKAREAREAEEKAKRDAEDARRRGDEEAAKIAREAEEKAKRDREAEEQIAEQARKDALKADTKADATEARGEARAQVHEVAAASVVAPIIVSAAPKVAGIARRMVWKYKVVDAAKVARLYLMLDEGKIAATVKNLGKDAVEAVGGIEVWQENDISARAK